MAASERFELRVSPEWLVALDAARGGVSRGAFVRGAVERASGGGDRVLLPSAPAESLGSGSDALPAAQEESNDVKRAQVEVGRRVLSSAEARAGVRPR